MDDNYMMEQLYARGCDAEEALAALQEKYGKLCIHLAENITGSRQDAEECAADAMLAVWNSIPPARPEKLSAYVCRLARNAAINRYHYNHAARRGGQKNYDLLLDELAEWIPSPLHAEDAADAHALAEALNRFLRGLSGKDRKLFLRRYWLGEPVAALAVQAGMTAHGCTVRLSRIRRKLEKFLQDEGVLS